MKALIDNFRGIGMAAIGIFLGLVLVAADIGSAATYQTDNGEVVIEAEKFTRLGGTTGGTWYVNNDISGYLGSGYLQSTTDDPRTLEYSSSIIRAEYDIDFTETGTYYLHLRTYATDHANNGYFATLDGRSFDYGHPDAYYITSYWKNLWWWYIDGGGAEGRGYKVSIDITKTGVQRLAIYRRDKGTRIDRIWLTKNQSEPQDTGTLDLTDPSFFLVDGSAVPTPTFDPDGGAHPGDTVNVTVRCATEGATIWYTTDGSEPSQTSPTVISGGEVVVALPGTLKAKAELGVNSSDTATSTYTRQDDMAYSVTVSFTGRGVGEVSTAHAGTACYGTNGDSCSDFYEAGSEITFIANPEPGSILKNWGGDCAGAPGDACSLVLDSDKIVQVNLLLQAEANPVGDISVVSLTPEERDLLMNIADGVTQFPVEASIREVLFQNNTATISYRDGTTRTVRVKDGESYSDDFIKLVLLDGNPDGAGFKSLLALPSFEATVDSAGDMALICYPGIVPVSGSSGILVGDLGLLKLKPVGQSSILFRYQARGQDLSMDGDFWVTDHLSDKILPSSESIDPDQLVDLYLVIEDNGMYDLEGDDGVVVDPLTLGRMPSGDTSATGSGGGGCFIDTLTGRPY